MKRFIITSLIAVSLLSMGCTKANPNVAPNDHAQTRAEAPVPLVDTQQVDTQQDDTSVVQEAMTRLAERLKSSENIDLLHEGTVDVNDEHCVSIASGNNTPDQFVRTNHYAVCPNNVIYELDIVTDEYKKLEN